MFEDRTGADAVRYSSESLGTDITTFRQHPTNVIYLAVRLVAAGEGEDGVGLERCRELRGVSRRLEGRLRRHECFYKGRFTDFARHVRVQGAAPLLEVVLSL